MDKEKINSANNFKDVEKNRWSYEAINYLNYIGVVEGYEGKFNPTDPMTRGEFATLLSNLKNLEINDKEFEDVKNHWSKEYVGRVATEGYMIGMPDGLFYPNKKITRGEAIASINRVLNKVSTEKEIKNKFVDLLETHWAYYEILKATN